MRQAILHQNGPGDQIRHDRDRFLGYYYDPCALGVHVLLNLVAAKTMLPYDGDCKRLVGAVAAVKMLQLLCFLGPFMPHYIKHRTLVVSLFRLLFVAATLYGQPQCSIHPEGRRPTSLDQHDVLDLVWHSGLSGLLWYPIALPLPLAAHAIVQLASTLMYVFTFNVSLCTRLLSCRSMLATSGLAETWGFLDSVSSDVLLAHGFPRQRAAQLNTEDAQCLTTVSFVQLGFGLGLPTLALYVWDRYRSRHIVKASGGAGHHVWQTGSISQLLIGGYTVTVLWAVLWELLYAFISNGLHSFQGGGLPRIRTVKGFVC